MAGMQTVGWSGLPPHHYYDLRAEPLGWCQRHIRWLPFLKDTKPRFRLTVTCIGSNVPAQTLRWFIMFENRMQTGHTIGVPPMTQGQRQEYTIGDRLLGFGGDTILGVDMPSGGFHTLVSFWTLRGETVLYGIILSLLSGVAGALLTLLFN
jgi:hypothetical protein